MLGDGLGVKLEGINTQLDKAVKSLTTLKTLSADVAKNVNGINSGSGGGGGMFGNGNSGNSMMPGGGGTFSGGAGGGGKIGMGALGTGGMGVLKGVVGMLGAGVQAVNNGLPDVTQTIQRASQYYGASLMGGRGVTANGMAKATFSMLSGGMTGAGNDAMLANRATASGISFGSSQYGSTMAGVSNAAKYLGVENNQAFDMITGLKTGAMSATLSRNFGIQTSSFKDGSPLTQGQIFDQLYSRMATPGKKATAEDVMASSQQGWLGANLRKSGLSQDQQQLFVQYAVEKAKGNNLDLENPEAVKKAMAANGQMNPGQAGYDINTSDTKLMQTVTDAYIKGQKDMVPVIQAANDALGKLPPAVFVAKAALDTLAGARATGAAMDAATVAAGSLATMLMGLGGVISGVMAKAGISAMAKGGGAVGTGGLAAGSKALGVVGKIAKVAGPIGAVVQAVGSGVGAYNTSMAGGDPWSNIWGDVATSAASGAVIGGLAGAPVGGVGALPGALIGAGVGAASVVLGTLFGSGVADANKVPTRGSGPAIPGAGSTTSPAPKGAIKHTAPCSGKIGSRFGDREGRSVPHNGVDFLVPQGTPVWASAAGTVIAASYMGIGGNTMQIEHADGIVTWYCHLSSFGAPVGKAVKQGERIATSGNTGDTTGAHLHWGAAQGRTQNWINPEQLLSGSLKGTGTVTGGANEAVKDTMSSTSSNSVGSHAGVASVDALSDMRAKAKAPSVQGLRSNSSQGGGVSIASQSSGTNGRSSGSGANSTTSSKKSSGEGQGQAESQGIYLAGAPRAKNGQSYVANDGPINVHAGEAILNAEQATEWRSAMLGKNGKGKGSNVVINLTVASASEAEARKFATIVKGYLEEDTMFGKMGKN
jgi:hypothetical protein